MKELLDEGRQTAADACLLAFNLAAHCERSGAYDEAFSYYRRANEYKIQVYRNDNKVFDQEKHRVLVDNLIGTFSPGFVERIKAVGDRQ